MRSINLRSFRQTVRHNKRRIRIFLSRLQRNVPRGLDRLILKTDELIWKNINCLDCANCCKTMSPTYSPADISRISKHLGMTEKSFKRKWLVRDKNGDWLNKELPCQFLDKESNKCGIYDVRPKDCAGFPHHNKKKMVDYMHVYKQNIEYCPATYKVIQKMMESIRFDKIPSDKA